MNKLNGYQSGFAISSLIFIMVGILIVGGGAGYLYLNSLNGPSANITSEPANFAAGDKNERDIGRHLCHDFGRGGQDDEIPQGLWPARPEMPRLFRHNS